MTEQQPIIVNASAIPDQLFAAGRQLLIVVGGYMVGKGWLEADTASAIGTILLIVLPFAYGQWKTNKRANQLSSLAQSPFVPDAVAMTK